jgi:hypothetical protein
MSREQEGELEILGGAFARFVNRCEVGYCSEGNSAEVVTRHYGDIVHGFELTNKDCKPVPFLLLFIFCVKCICSNKLSCQQSIKKSGKMLYLLRASLIIGIICFINK